MIKKCLNHMLLTGVIWLLAGTVQAETFSENELKTLFTTPEQRNQIDAGRMGKVVGSTSPQFGPNNVSINGVVKRSNGKSVVWVNGKSTLENSSVDGVRVHTRSLDKKSKIPVIIDGRTVYLQPGQTWSEETGKIIDSY